MGPDKKEEQVDNNFQRLRRKQTGGQYSNLVKNVPLLTSAPGTSVIPLNGLDVVNNEHGKAGSDDFSFESSKSNSDQETLIKTQDFENNFYVGLKKQNVKAQEESWYITPDPENKAHTITPKIKNDKFPNQKLEVSSNKVTASKDLVNAMKDNPEAFARLVVAAYAATGNKSPVVIKCKDPKLLEAFDKVLDEFKIKKASDPGQAPTPSMRS